MSWFLFGTNDSKYYVFIRATFFAFFCLFFYINQSISSVLRPQFSTLATKITGRCSTASAGEG